MPRIGLTEGFSVIPEGRHIFKITAAAYKEEYGKLEFKMETARGLKHIERFYLLDKNTRKPSEGAYNAFSYFAKTALNDYERTDVDPEELVGCFIECLVEHDKQPSNKDPKKTVTFIRLSEKSPADGFTEPVKTQPAKAEAPAAPKKINAAEIDLDDLLG